NRFDLRQSLYIPSWPHKFSKIDDQLNGNKPLLRASGEHRQIRVTSDRSGGGLREEQGM
ncbi:hypothetical protein MKX03_002132, partial [Papaver bracteatum]